jgi:hypothetical protein
MQKLADGHDTEVGSSLAWLWSRCVAAPQPGAAPACVVAACVVAACVVAACVVAGCAVAACVVAGCAVAGWPPAGELAAGPGGADEPVHPVAAPVSRTATHAQASRSRPVMCASMVLRGLGDVVDEGGQAGLVEQVGGADGYVAGDVVEGGADLRHGDPGERRPGQAVGGELDGDGVPFGG